MDLYRLQPKLSALIAATDLPNSNAPDMQKQLAHYHIGDVLEGLAKQYKAPATKALRAEFAQKLTKPMPVTTLVTVRPFVLTAKVSNPRQSFDKDMFIREAAAKFDLPISKLAALAAKCVKESAAPVSLSVELTTDVEAQS